MATYWDEHGNRLTLGKCVGSGGEGEIYELAEYPARVAKLYHPNRLGGNLESKLRAMLSATADQIRGVAAWPESLLLEKAGGRMCGFTMRSVGGREIHDLYQPKARAKYFPDKDWQFLVYVGRNLAAAVETLHLYRIVIGDVNQRNLRVTSKGLINFVDCDSFQLRGADGAFYPASGVGVEEYTPPELQGCNLGNVRFTPLHDTFGLAVILFQLLYLGKHPFYFAAGGGAEPPSMGNMIRSGSCVLSLSDGAVPPPGAYGASSELTTLFRRAFVGRHYLGRPTAGQWRLALEMLLKRIRRCNTDPGHVFFVGLANCPWCALATREPDPYDPFAGVRIHRWLNAHVQELACGLRERAEQLLRPFPPARVPEIAVTPAPLPRHVQAACLKLNAASPWRIIPLEQEVRAIRGEVERRRRAVEAAQEQMPPLCRAHERLRMRAESAAKGSWADAEVVLRSLSGLPEILRPAAALPDNLFAALKEEAVVKRTRIVGEIMRRIDAGEAVRRAFEHELANSQSAIECAAGRLVMAEADWRLVEGLKDI